MHDVWINLFSLPRKTNKNTEKAPGEKEEIVQLLDTFVYSIFFFFLTAVLTVSYENIHFGFQTF